MAKRKIEIKTQDGVAQGVDVRRRRSHAKGGSHPVHGRFRSDGRRWTSMAERLSGQGYAVLVPDLFYRHGPYGPFNAKTAFGDPQSGALIRKMMTETTQAMSQRDTGAFLDALAG